MFFSSKRTSLLLVGLLAASLNVIPADSPRPARAIAPYSETVFSAAQPAVAPVPAAVPVTAPVQRPVAVVPAPVAPVLQAQPVSQPVAVIPQASNRAVVMPPVTNSAGSSAKRISLTLRDTPIAEVFDMLARSERVNIVLGKTVSGNISVSLYDVSLDQAVRAAAEAGGYVAERRGKAWLITDRAELGREMPSSETIVKAFKIQYSDAKLVGDIITKHLSRYGKVTPLLGRNMLIVEDRPEVIAKVAAILDEVDREPRQIMIEAKILQIDLTDEDQFGINWNRIFTASGGGQGSAGVRGYSLPTAGFFATVTGNLSGTLAALSKRNNVRTLSTPRLLAIEGQQAQVQIGGQRGYKVTTIVNLTATETIQFLDAGVILKVTPFVDDAGRIHMKIQPEVSDYDFVGGIPGKKTTTVSTNAIASNGETIFIGGLIKGKAQRDRQGVPGLSEVPVLGALFSYQTTSEEASETVVLITPHLVEENRSSRFELNPDLKTQQFLEERERRLNLMQPPVPVMPPQAQPQVLPSPVLQQDVVPAPPPAIPVLPTAPDRRSELLPAPSVPGVSGDLAPVLSPPVGAALPQVPPSLEPIRLQPVGNAADLLEEGLRSPQPSAQATVAVVASEARVMSLPSRAAQADLALVYAGVGNPESGPSAPSQTLDHPSGIQAGTGLSPPNLPGGG